MGLLIYMDPQTCKLELLFQNLRSRSFQVHTFECEHVYLHKYVYMNGNVQRNKTVFVFVLMTIYTLVSLNKALGNICLEIMTI